MNSAGTDIYRLTCSANAFSDSCLISVNVVEATLPETVTLGKSIYTGTVNETISVETDFTSAPAGTALPSEAEITVDGGSAFRDALSWRYSYGEPTKLIFEKAGSYTAYLVFSGANYSYRCPITLEVADENGVVPPTITDVTVSEASLMLSVGDTWTLSASVGPADASYSNLTWASANTAVATVSSTGKVTAIGPGFAVITASIPESNYDGSCLIYVEEGINFWEDTVERTVFVDGETRMTLDTLMLTNNTCARLSAAPEWTLKRISGISLTLRAEPFETVDAQGNTLYGCALNLYSVSKEGDTVYELICSDGIDSRTATITVHAVSRDRVLPASITLDETDFTAGIGELIKLQPVVTAYPAGSRLPEGIVVSCVGDAQFQQALNTQDTYVSQSLSTFSFSKAGTYHAELVYSFSNMNYIVPVTFRIRDENGEVPVQATKMVINKKALYLTAGDTAKLEAVFTPVDATDQAVTWRSSDTAVVTVDTNGNVTAVKNGSATIYCVPSDKECTTVSCPVTVEDYLTVEHGATSRILYLQGEQENFVCYTQLSIGTLDRMEAEGLTPVWTFEAAGTTHTELISEEKENGNSYAVYTEKLLSGGTDTFTIHCQVGEHSWSQAFTLNITDLGTSAPQTVKINTTEINAAVGEAITIDFTPICVPAGTSMPEDINDYGFMGVGSFYDNLDKSIYAENGDMVTLAFTKPGQYLITREYVRRNLKYVTFCTITVGGEKNGRGILSASETAFTVYSGGRSGIVSTVAIQDALVTELWGNTLEWSAQRLSGDSMTVALKERGDSVDVFVANVKKNGTDVWRISCTYGGMTDWVDITLTADDPRGPLPEHIALTNDHVTGIIGDEITVPLGVICSPSGSMLPDQGDSFWMFYFDQAGEERSIHSIENGLLKLSFAMSGYYTGTLRYQSGNVKYELPIYFVIYDEEQEVLKPELKLFAVNTFDTVYPEGETDFSIGQMVIAESLSTYSYGSAVCFMKDANAVWKVTQTGTAADLSLIKKSDNVYDLILNSISSSGNISYMVTCTIDGHVYMVTGSLHVADNSEKRPDATLKHTSYQVAVGEEVSIDSRMYSREDGSALQASTEFDASSLLEAVGYEVVSGDDTWTMTFYQPGTYSVSVSAQVSNLRVKVPVIIVVNERGEEKILMTIKLPAALTVIEEEAFEETSANVIDFRETKIKTIGPGAFRNSINIEKVYLPNSVMDIADDAFYGCLNLSFVCDSNSYAASWAAAHHIPVITP